MKPSSQVYKVMYSLRFRIGRHVPVLQSCRWCYKNSWRFPQLQKITAPQSRPSWNELTWACLVCNNQSQAWSCVVFMFRDHTAALYITRQAELLHNVQISIQTLQISFLEVRQTSPHEAFNTCFLWDTWGRHIFSNCCSSNITGQMNSLRKGLSGPDWQVLLRLTGEIVTSPFLPIEQGQICSFRHPTVG